MAEFKAPPDMSFEGNIDENWKVWQQQFEYFMIASGKTAKSDAEKIAILLNMMGLEAQRIYNTFDFETSADKESYSATLNKFQQYCAPKKNLVYEHFVFFSRAQGEDETADQFFTALKKMAATCEFAERDVMIRDRIVLGTRHKQLQEKLLSEPTLGMEAAIDHCRRYERTKQLVKEIQKPQEEARADAIVKTKWRPNQEEKPQQATMPRWRLQRGEAEAKNHSHKAPNDQTNPKRCTNCGTVHEYRKCPAYGRRCQNCNYRNHYAAMCRKRAIHALDYLETQPEDDPYTTEPAILYSISEEDASDWYEILTISKHQVKFKMDTGAQVNVINGRVYKAIANKAQLEPSTRKLMSYTGHTIEIEGVAKFRCTWERHDTTTAFYVTKSESATCILGLPTIKKLGIIKPGKQDKVQSVAAVSPQQILDKYRDVFEGKGTLDHKYKITLTSEAQPIAVPPRAIPMALKQGVRRELESMVEQGVLVPVTEPTQWSSPITIVTNQKRRPRICMDPRNLNKYIVRERCWIPTVNSIFAELGKAKVFTVLDASNAFHQIQLDIESSKLCTIATPFGRYRYTRLPYGLSSAPEVFQSALATMLEGIKGTLNYIDDILIYGTTMEEHNTALEQVLKRARQTGLKLSKEKTQLATETIRFLGHVITKDGIQVDPEKTQAIRNMKPPNTKKELQRFLGVITYLARYLPKLAETSAPLRAILSKKNFWQWEPQGPEEEAFTKLKDMVSNAPTLRHYDPDAPVKLSVDASRYGLGAVLLQASSPVAYASASLTPAQQRYNQIEKELLAIVYACEHFNHYVLGRDVTVETDHSPLLAIVKKPLDSLTPRLQRLVMRLLRYSVTLTYVQGRKIQAADALSRDPTENTYPTSYLEEVYTECPLRFKNPTRYQALVKATKEDEDYRQIMQYTKEGWPLRKADTPHIYQKYWEMQSELTTDKGLLYKGRAICIPKAIREEMLEILHATHQGETATKARAKDTIYWPGITKDIETKIKTCVTCQLYARANTREPLTPHPVPRHPWERIAIDFKEASAKNYLVMVDAHSKFLVVEELQNKTAETVVQALIKNFAKLGVPDVICSDNGPPFDSKLYLNFLKKYNIIAQKSSPNYPESNGLIERHVQVVKAMLHKTSQHPSSLPEAVLNYNATPKANLPSPAEMLQGRKFKTQLPRSETYNTPLFNTAKQYTQLVENTDRMTLQQGHSKLPELHPGQPVALQLATRNWKPGTVTTKLDHNSYNIQMDTGAILRRNRLHLRPMRYQTKEEPGMDSHKINKEDLETITDPHTDNKQIDPTEYRTRSGRLVIPPRKMDL